MTHASELRAMVRRGADMNEVECRSLVSSAVALMDKAKAAALIDQFERAFQILQAERKSLGYDDFYLEAVLGIVDQIEAAHRH